MIKLSKKNNTQLLKKNDHGFIALTSVVLITAILTLIVISISIQSIDESQISQAFEKSKQAQYDTQSCLNYMLLELSNDQNYSPVSTLEITHGDYSINCVNTKIISNGDNTDVKASSEQDFYVDSIITLSSTTFPFYIVSFETR